MSETELFPIEPSLSPRLRWLARHGLTLTKLPNGKYEVNLDDENFARGEDQDEAIVAFCVATGLRHPSQE